MFVKRVSSHTDNQKLLEIAEEIRNMPFDEVLARLPEQDIVALANISGRLETSGELTEPARIKLADVINRFYDTKLDPGRVLRARQKVENDQRITTLLSDPDTIEFLKSRATQHELEVLSAICRISQSSKPLTDPQVDFIDSLFRLTQARSVFSAKVTKIKKELETDFTNAVPALLGLIGESHQIDTNRELYDLIDELTKKNPDKGAEFSKAFVKYASDRKLFLIELLAIGLSTSNRSNIAFLFRGAFHEIPSFKQEESIKTLIRAIIERGDKECAELANEIYEYICHPPKGQGFKYPIALRNELKDFLTKVGSTPLFAESREAEKQARAAQEKIVQVSENIKDGKKKRAEVVLEIRNLWSNGYLPYAGWLEKHKPELYKTIKNKYVFGSVPNALKAAGLPEGFTSVSVNGMSKKLSIATPELDKAVDEAIKELYANKQSLEVLDIWNSKENYILRAAVNLTYSDGALIYGIWANAVRKNTNKEITMPELSPVSEEAIERFAPAVAVEPKEAKEAEVAHIEPEDCVFVPRQGLKQKKDKELIDFAKRVLIARDRDKKLKIEIYITNLEEAIGNYSKNNKLYAKDRNNLLTALYVYAYAN